MQRPPTLLAAYETTFAGAMNKATYVCLFQALGSFRSSPTTESLEQAKFSNMSLLG